MQKDIFNWKAAKRMKALGVDEAAEEAFEREKREGCVNAGYAKFTENWVYFNNTWTSGLFPLKEIVSFQKGYSNMSDNVRFFVTLWFRDGSKYNLPCEFSHLDRIAAALTELCPQTGRTGSSK